MADIVVAKKSKRWPLWAWLVCLLALVGVLFAVARRGRATSDPGANAGTSPGQVGPAPVALTGAAMCKDDSGCSPKELCLDGSCRVIDASTSACSTASAHFANGSVELDARQKALLERTARCVRADRPTTIRLEESAAPRAGRAHEDDLTERRARAIARELTTRGVSAAKLDAVSYGSNRVLCPENDDACWAKNSRADLQAKALNPSINPNPQPMRNR